jgi:hypothetical protein
MGLNSFLSLSYFLIAFSKAINNTPTGRRVVEGILESCFLIVKLEDTVQLDKKDGKSWVKPVQLLELAER